MAQSGLIYVVQEDALADLLKKVGGGFALSSVIGKGGSKFNTLDVKRVYFGNWLRDYSQARVLLCLMQLKAQCTLVIGCGHRWFEKATSTNHYQSLHGARVSGMLVSSVRRDTQLNILTGSRLCYS